MTEPTFALSVRQPWAWCILNGKPLENRMWRTTHRGPLWLHAARNMTPEEYRACQAFIDRFSTLQLPAPGDLFQGGIIGKTNVIDVVSHSDSPWFTGPYAFALKDSIAVPFRPCRGKPGLFIPEFLPQTPMDPNPTLL